MNRRSFSKITATSTLGIFPFLAQATPAEFCKNKQPKLLKKGDTIGLITPGSFISDDGLKTAVEHVESLGFKVKLAKNIRAERGFESCRPKSQGYDCDGPKSTQGNGETVDD